MPQKIKPSRDEKDKLHPRNRHRQRYNFPQLIKSYPELGPFVSLNQFNDLSIDFKNPNAVIALNKALLKHFYNIALWNIPEGYLCPPIPGRADYIHYMADLLAEGEGITPKGKAVKVLDIGVGANCIYPLIGNSEYGWSFVGSDVDRSSIRFAKNMIAANGLSKAIEIRQQTSANHFFTGIIKTGEIFDLTICNPPFHASQKEAAAGTERKWSNLGHKGAELNFGGSKFELWCEGGEERFVEQMIAESSVFAKSCFWFTSLISKKESLPACYYALKEAGALEVKTIPMAQGQKVSRVLAWTFLDMAEQNTWKAKRWPK